MQSIPSRPCRATAPVAESKTLAGDAPALQLLENGKKTARRMTKDE